MTLRNTLLIALTLGGTCAAAQEALADPGQKTVELVRTPSPPVIDGDLGDSVWNNAALVNDLRLAQYGNGQFYGGDRKDVYVQLTWRPSPHFRSQFYYDYAGIDLPQGSFATRLLRMALDLVFSPRLSWINLIQYDNLTETVGLNSRLHWIPEAGKEFFLVLNHSMEDVDRSNRFQSIYSDVTANLNYTFKF